MKPMYEKIVTNPNSTWRTWLYEVSQLDFCWHYHPEYEIALTVNANGKRYVGDHIGEFIQYDLTMVGSNLPHTWTTDKNADNSKQHIYVIQIPAPWVESLVYSMPELESLKQLLHNSRRGITFDPIIIPRCLELCRAIKQTVGVEQITNLLYLLNILANDDAATMLSSPSFSVNTEPDPASEKLDKIIRYLHQHYCQPLKAEDVAQLVNMSTNHFHRFLKQRTEQTFTELVNQLRISKACTLLVNTTLPVTSISEQCGFNNISNFNRRFHQHRSCTPSQFRRSHKFQTV